MKLSAGEMELRFRCLDYATKSGGDAMINAEQFYWFVTGHKITYSSTEHETVIVIPTDKKRKTKT